MIIFTHPYSISEIFSNENIRFYTIPKYQRAYTWGQKEWNLLFDDIIDNDDGYVYGVLNGYDINTNKYTIEGVSYNDNIKIDSFFKLHTLNKNDISQIIFNNSLWSFNNLKKFIIENKTKFSLSTLSNIAELANIKRQQNSAYFTNKFILNEIAKSLPNFNQDSITIVEPSVGCGNFIPIIVKKYEVV